MKQAKTIDDVILILESIITECQNTQSSLGYFAALYQNVTKKVKEGIENNTFNDGPRMEALDVIFANRYLEAYYAYREKKDTTYSWDSAFSYGTNYWPIVLQHLLMGMNAHISLDLGIAAAQVSKGQPIDHLKDDFFKINEILSALVTDVQEQLAKIWPRLKRLLKHTNKVDDFLIDFSMEIARDDAWTFARLLANASLNEQAKLIKTKDLKVSKNTKIITPNGIIARIIFAMIRLGERGSIREKITTLKT